MEVVNAVDAVAQLFEVAAPIALGVLGVDLSNVVEWLVDVTSVMDHEAESEGFLVFLVFEGVLDLSDVGGAVGT